jgi:hypothetical protein
MNCFHNESRLSTGVYGWIGAATGGFSDRTPGGFMLDSVRPIRDAVRYSNPAPVLLERQPCKHFREEPQGQNICVWTYVQTAQGTPRSLGC